MTPLLTRPRLARTSAPARDRRAAARLAVLLFALLTPAAHAAFGAYLDYGPPRLRDPEYGKRHAAALNRAAAEPSRPLVVVVGSSRASMGIRPGALPADGPMVANLSLAGSGPVMQRMALRRLLHAGGRPKVVLFEFWPAFLRESGPYLEESRIDPCRLRPEDERIIADHFQAPAGTFARMRELRLLPLYGHRKSLLNQFAGSWLPHALRNDPNYEKIDEFGWLPGRESSTPEQRDAAAPSVASYYWPLFQGYEVSPVADAALRAAVADARAAGAVAGLVYLPESARFRSLMTPEAIRLSDDYLAKIRAELNMPMIDARGWVPDDDLPDGFHPTWNAAAAITRRLAAAVAETFPVLRGAP